MQYFAVEVLKMTSYYSASATCLQLITAAKHLVKCSVVKEGPLAHRNRKGCITLNYKINLQKEEKGQFYYECEHIRCH